MTNLLAIDTSTEQASVALLSNHHILVKEQGSQKTHAQVLLPMIEQLMVDAALSIQQLDGIIFGSGPGSFTGLRIACSIAKGLAYAHDIGLIPVSSLGAITWSVREVLNDMNAPVLAVLDARMHEVYWSYYAPGHHTALEQVSSAQEIQLAGDHSLVLAGVGIDLYRDELPESLRGRISHQIATVPQAAAMITLAQHLAIQPISAADAQPVYVRNQVTQGASRG